MVGAVRSLLPWKHVGRNISGADGWSVASTINHDPADAEFIVRAVNNHESLLAALKESRPHVAASAEASHLLQGFTRSETAEDRLLQTVDAAIAKAEQP